MRTILPPEGPSVTTWTRLEPRPREGSMQRSLQAQVRDPLWMLARQWQVGEFAGDDAGSPVQATLQVENRKIDGYRPGTGGAFAPYDVALPLETHVERETVTLRLRWALQIGTFFEAAVLERGIINAAAILAAFRAVAHSAILTPDTPFFVQDVVVQRGWPRSTAAHAPRALDRRCNPRVAVARQDDGHRSGLVGAALRLPAQQSGTRNVLAMM